MTLYVEKLTFVVSLLFLLGLTMLKLYNVMHKGEKYNFQFIFLTFILGLFGYGMAMVVFMTLAEELTIIALWNIAPFLLGLFVVMFIIEVLLLVVQAQQTAVRGRYSPDKNPYYDRKLRR